MYLPSLSHSCYCMMLTTLVLHPPSFLWKRQVTYVKSLWRRRSERRVGERAVTYVKERKSWRRSFDVGKALVILQPFRHFTYVKSSFSKPSVALPTSQLILQPFRRFTYVTAHSPTILLLHLHHRSFSNPSFPSPTSLALHLRHLASRPWHKHYFNIDKMRLSRAI